MFYLRYFSKWNALNWAISSTRHFSASRRWSLPFTKNTGSLLLLIHGNHVPQQIHVRQICAMYQWNQILCNVNFLDHASWTRNFIVLFVVVPCNLARSDKCQHKRHSDLGVCQHLTSSLWIIIHASVIFRLSLYFGSQDDSRKRIKLNSSCYWQPPKPSPPPALLISTSCISHKTHNITGLPKEVNTAF